MTLDEIEAIAINPAAALLPPKWDVPEARILQFAIGLQESGFVHRRQMNNGPAASFWQMEKGGGIKGVLNHAASKAHARAVCEARGVAPIPTAVWDAMLTDDVLGAAFARLLLYTDPFALPKIGNVAGAWELYAVRCWRPGKPHRETWDGYYAEAREQVSSTTKGTP